MINYCRRASNAEVVAICDNNPDVLKNQMEAFKGQGVEFYDNFDNFIKHDMDAVVLANFANEHAPFAIRAMKEGKHVFSECLPAQTMKEAIELIETVEETGLIYAYGENYCYMPVPYEMKKLYKENKIGEFEYGEGEYIHNCGNMWPEITYGEEDHWRNNMYSTYYCTHSIGPLIHATGLRPVSVVGFEGTANLEKRRSNGSKSGKFAMELITLENGGIIRSVHGGLYVNSVWFSMYGTKGTMECGREQLKDSGHLYRIYVKADEFVGEYADRPMESYEPEREFDELAKKFGHEGSDFYCMWHFVEKIRGNKEADIIDVYEAMDMFLPGMFAYRSILTGNIPVEIPNLRDKSVREVWRNDTACTDPKVAGDMLWPTCSTGTPKIDPSVYEMVKKKWEESQAKGVNIYAKEAFSNDEE